jgi:hypothetical protein
MFHHHRLHARRHRRDAALADPARYAAHLAHRFRRRLAWGGVLIAVGVATLAKGPAFFEALDPWLIVPAVLALSGLVRLVAGRRPRALMSGTLRLALAAWLFICIEHVGNATFASTWPIAVMGLGVATVARALLTRAPAACTEPT